MEVPGVSMAWRLSTIAHRQIPQMRAVKSFTSSQDLQQERSKKRSGSKMLP